MTLAIRIFDLDKQYMNSPESISDLSFSFHGINHVTLPVSDKTKSETFYVGILGLIKINIGSSLWIRIGEQFIHLNQSTVIPSSSFAHFAIRVENLRSYLNVLQNKGVDIFDLDDDLKEISLNTDFEKANRQFFLRDPDGHLLELIDATNSFFHPV